LPRKVLPAVRTETAPTVETRALAAMARTGAPGRLAAARMDRLRSSGWRVLAQHSRQGRDALDRRLATQHAEAYRSIWDEAAEAVGAEIEELAAGFFLIRRGAAETVVHRHLVMLDHPSTMALALDKSAVHQLLTRGGLQVPEHAEFARTERDAALAFLEGSPQPCVVKPSNGTSGGAGVTCGVRDADDLWRAWLAAGRWDGRILVERQVTGEEYRLLFLDGQLLGAVRRQPPRLRGTGIASVSRLIEDENRRRLHAGGLEVARPLRIDLDCELALRESGLTLRSVVPEGRSVAIKHTVGDNAVADNTAVTGLSPELVSEAARAAELTRLRLAGIDVVTRDPTVSLGVSHGAILEVNATPGLHYHYQVANPGEAEPVAVALLDRLLTGASNPDRQNLADSTG